MFLFIAIVKVLMPVPRSLFDILLFHADSPVNPLRLTEPDVLKLKSYAIVSFPIARATEAYFPEWNYVHIQGL